MRSICCFLSLFFFVLYLIGGWPHLRNINQDFLYAVGMTLFLGLLGYGLYQIIRRLRINPALWRIIWALIGLLIVLIIIGVPEIRVVILGWLEKISDPAEHLLVLSFLCLVVCVRFRTRPARSSTTAE